MKFFLITNNIETKYKKDQLYSAILESLLIVYLKVYPF